jgi:predicted ATPase
VYSGASRLFGIAATSLPFAGTATVAGTARFERRVFFVRNLGFITPTEARRISYEETVRFEKLHEQAYREFGFDIISIAPASVVNRVREIKRFLSREHT